MDDPLYETVAAAVAEVKHLRPDRIAPDSSFADLGMDSLDAITLLFELETRLGVAIPDEAAKSVRTVRDVVERLRALVGVVVPSRAPLPD